MPVDKFFNKRTGGVLDGRSLDRKEMNKLFEKYYELHGWDKMSSIPEKETLKSLDLEFIADEFEKKGLFKKGAMKNS